MNYGPLQAVSYPRYFVKPHNYIRTIGLFHYFIFNILSLKQGLCLHI